MLSAFRSARRGRLLMAAAATAAVAATAGAGSATAAPLKAPKTAKLDAYDSCVDLVRGMRTKALELAGPYGLGGYPGLMPLFTRFGEAMPVAAPAPATGASPERAADSAAPQAGVDFSGTNVQEEGVDEPDIVKTDGRRLFTLAQGKIQAVAVGEGTATKLGSLALDKMYPTEMLLQGDRLVVIGPVDTGPIPYGPGPADEPLTRMIAPYPMPPAQTALVEIDVSDASKMRVISRLTLDGSYVTARVTGTTARVVIQSSPAFIPLTAPAEDTPVAVEKAEAANESAIRHTTTKHWLPHYTLARKGRAVEKGRAVRCRAVSHTDRFSGLGMVTVVTLDLNKGMRISDSDAVQTDGNLVYASLSGLYVATPRWFPQGEPLTDAQVAGSTTLIHRFDISAPTTTEYRSSGIVKGFPLNQFSFSEFNGHLRVATTEEPSWVDGQQANDSESFVTVLREQGTSLSRVGLVGGLGKGERIYAVRFIGDRGYVVTFRQTDPLYTLDLADPANPVVRGELKIPGYSSYLHPAGDNLLIGIGQDATNEGRVTGSQVSLFDVSDPAKPVRLASKNLGRGWSEAESDHHAVLYWGPTHLLVVPLQTYDYEAGSPPPFSGAAGLRVGRAEGVAEVGRLSHPVPAGQEFAPTVRRSVVVGDALLTVSEAGVKASSLATLTDRAWVPFS